MYETAFKTRSYIGHAKKLATAWGIWEVKLKTQKVIYEY